MINKMIVAFVLSLTMFVSGCSMTEDMDPVSTGEVIGLTYQITKDELSEGDRKNVEEAYLVFSEFLDSYDEDLQQGDVKLLIFALADQKIEDPAERAAVKLIITLYWNRVQDKVDINVMKLNDQIAVLKQVKIGIERGLGH